MMNEKELIKKGLLPPWGYHKGNVSVEDQIDHLSRKMFLNQAKRPFWMNPKTKKQLKREARSNTFAGIQAKKRSLLKSLKRASKKMNRKVLVVGAAGGGLDLNHSYGCSHTSLPSQPLMPFVYGKETSGYAALAAMEIGIKARAPEIYFGRSDEWPHL